MAGPLFWIVQGDSSTCPPGIIDVGVTVSVVEIRRSGWATATVRVPKLAMLFLRLLVDLDFCYQLYVDCDKRPTVFGVVTGLK